MSSDLVILLAHRHQAELSQVLLLSQLAAYRRVTLQPTVDKYATWWDLDRRCTDVSSSRIQLSKLQVHGLICTHMLSCCIPDAIYSYINVPQNDDIKIMKIVVTGDIKSPYFFHAYLIILKHFPSESLATYSVGVLMFRRKPHAAVRTSS